MADKVRYRVLKRVFVNGSVVEPIEGQDVFVEAAAGLDGTALKRADAMAKATQPERSKDKVSP